MKRTVIVSLFFLIGAASAQEELVINADNVDYDKTAGIVDARGSVVLEYGGVTIEAVHVVYDSAKGRAYADEGFTLYVDNQTVAGTTLDYSVSSKEGKAEDVNVYFAGMFMRGKYIEMSPEEITLRESSFTTCDLNPPHYKISASTITIYPKSAFLAAYWGWFHLGPVPLVPVPTYIYDMRPGREGRNAVPVPVVGSNDVDGTYIVERIGWHSSDRLYGDVSLTYATLKGPGGGVSANYLASEEDSYYARIGTNRDDGWWGGLTLYKDFGGEIGEKASDRDMSSVIQTKREKWYSMDINLSSRERINYQHVSFLPEVGLKKNKDFLFGDVKYSAEIRQAKIIEESTTLEASRTTLNLSLFYGYQLSPTLGMSVKTAYEGKKYTEGSRWDKINGVLTFTNIWNENFTSETGLRHYFLHEGMSPFAFEAYWYRPSDEIFLGTVADFKWWKYGFNLEYYIPSWDLKDVDHSVSAQIHCAMATVTYRVMRKEFEMSLGLAFL